ncbi:folylpolyglutamate synthase/dihydrofolate synthase family protein [Ornithinibacillus sp. JPR2-1]|uniref:bifunctional folylpolyglutamate synthase/dihydrofolate synthase n=1 Tax=Ornithinibacillus sp. JPR2-1 TaxID=2094019 RepID=UPI0031D30CFF
MFHSIEQIEAFIAERRTLGIKPGLDRMVALLESQQNPQQKIKAIHIAGTNGKGSTLTYLKAALIENNYRVGIFTSPSLTGLTGHIFINDLPIPDDRFITLFNQLLPSIKELDLVEMHATEFEIITTIAYMYFSETVDIAIIEAGMGGREDSTNCIQPILSIITNIAMDHATFLGDTLEEIAFHKAGIIKGHTPVVIGAVEESCMPILEKEARKKYANMYKLNRDFFYKRTFIDENRQFFEWCYQGTKLEMEIQMIGKHQIINAATALMALVMIEKSGVDLNWDNVYQGIKTAHLPGRFEKIHDNPIVILDGAHNPKGMEAFLHTVNDLYRTKRKNLIFAGFKDKELKKMLQQALPYFDTIMVTSFDHPRAETAENLLEMVPVEKVRQIKWQEEWKEIGERDEMYFFAGSLHFIGLIRAYVKKQTL